MVELIKGNGSPLISVKVDRNALCKCGSGKKQKKCCGVERRWFNSRPTAADKIQKETENAPKQEENNGKTI